MIAVMLFSIFVGFPISFTLIFLGVVFGAWGFGAKLTFYLQTFQFNATMLDDQLVAVPLFVLMGIIMERAGLMERLFLSIQMMFSRTRGALFVAVLFVSMIFAAATGIVGASVTILGIMAARTMNRSGYDVRLASGTITAGGTLGILIPPSIMLVVMGPVLEVPVTTLFQAAIIPGIMLAFLYMLYALVRCWINPDLGPILPPEEQPQTSPFFIWEFASVLAALVILIWLITLSATGALGGLFPLAGLVIPIGWILIMNAAYHWTRRERPRGFYYSDLWYEFFMGLVPPTTLIAFALGSILAGWATPSEAAACGAFGALVLSIAYRRFTWSSFFDALVKTLEITVLIMFLVAASNFFGAVFSRLGTPTMLTDLLLMMELSPTMILIVIMALVFLLGWPLEWVPIVLIIVPILIPTIVALDMPYFETPQLLLTWFGILEAVNLQTAWLSPPVALSAYFLKGVVPEWDLKDIYLGMMQFMVIQVVGLVLIFMFPQIALWLPSVIYGP
ncbi:MAG: TRAP transporter large permease subunit [Pseudomonadota bacterium]